MYSALNERIRKMIFEKIEGQTKQNHLVQIVVPHVLLDRLDKQAKEEVSNPRLKAGGFATTRERVRL